MSANHQWRRRRSAAPLSLAIVDHDTKRFTIEGPIDCEEPWVSEIRRAQRAGRNIKFSIADNVKIRRDIINKHNAGDYDYWPPNSIILI
jgi:hypothetical protein